MARLYGTGTDTEKAASEQMKAAQAEAGKKQFKYELVIAGVLIFIGIVVIVANIISVSGLDEKSEALRVEAQGVEMELAKLNETPSESVSDAEIQTIQAELYSAKEAGTRLCEIQNEMSKSGKSLEEMEALKNELYTYLPDSNPSRTRQPWFRIYYSHDDVDDAIDGPVWSFDSTYDIANSKVPVVFRCYDGTGKYTDYPLAIVIGTYDAETNTFINCSYIETQYGSWYFREMSPEEIDCDPNETTGETSETEPTETSNYADGVIDIATDPAEIDDDGETPEETPAETSVNTEPATTAEVE